MWGRLTENTHWQTVFCVPLVTDTKLLCCKIFLLHYKIIILFCAGVPGPYYIRNGASKIGHVSMRMVNLLLAMGNTMSGRVANRVHWAPSDPWHGAPGAPHKFINMIVFFRAGLTTKFWLLSPHEENDKLNIHTP